MIDRRLRPLLYLFSALLILVAATASATNFTINATGDGYYYEAVFQGLPEVFDPTFTCVAADLARLRASLVQQIRDNGLPPYC